MRKLQSGELADYHRVSDAAKQVRDFGDKSWKKDVTFEHVRPISKMYQMLLHERGNVDLDRAASIIGEYPPVLITVKEELRMSESDSSMMASPKSDTPTFRLGASLCVQK